jgi:hypothetical protein
MIVHQATPIDRALPFLVIVIGAVAAVTHEAILTSALMLMGAEIAIPEERARLLAFGVVVGIALAAAILVRRPAWSFARAATLTVAAILILRWIPLENVLYGREIALIIIAVGIVSALRSAPWAVALAVAVVLFTPAIPLRTLALPIVVLIAACAAALRGRETRALLLHSSAFVLMVMLMFFPWSGAFARALPVMLRGVTITEREPVRIALAAGQSVELQVPHGAVSIILSGSNIPKLRKGVVVGRVDPGGVPLRVGDFADWGVLRREQFYASRNPLPRDPAGLLRDYGQASWIDGAGRIRLPKTPTIRITARQDLPPGARLQIDAFEMECR